MEKQRVSEEREGGKAGRREDEGSGGERAEINAEASSP